MVEPVDPLECCELDGEYQKVWGAALCGQGSQGDFLVREPVNPIPDRACIAA